MDRTHLDWIVAAVVGLVVLLGGSAAWQATQSTGGHMGPGGGGMQTTNSLWLLVGTLVVAGVVVVLYLGVRQQLAAEESTGSTEPTGAPPVGGEPTPAADPEQSPDDAASTDVDQSDERTEAKPERTPSRQVVDLLPDDERRIVQPVIESPGLTQIELRDRASFSKSKVSQTVTDLEKRGLLYREPQGRTYRVYPSDELSAK